MPPKKRIEETQAKHKETVQEFPRIEEHGKASLGA